MPLFESMKIFLSFICANVIIQISLFAQVNIQQAGVAYFNNMDSLARSGTVSNPLPEGWLFAEIGTNSNNTYIADIGSATAGNTYSFGSSNSADRALGSLASGSLNSNIGARFINQTGNTINTVELNFLMEQWRSGGRTTPDTSSFFYGINNGGLLAANGTWTRDSRLDLLSKRYSSPAPVAGALNGNDTSNQRVYAGVELTGLTLNNGDTLYLRWFDINVAGNDDALAIDSFTIVFKTSSAITKPNPITSFSFSQITQQQARINWPKPTGYTDSAQTMLLFIKVASAPTTGNINQAPGRFTSSDDFLSTQSSRYPFDTTAKCIYKGDSNSVSVRGLNAATWYYIIGYAARDNDSSYSVIRSDSFQTASPPQPVSNITMVGDMVTSAQISWVLPPSYNTAASSVLVFIKADSAIKLQTPNVSVSRYQANTIIGLGTAYQNDGAAFCIAKTDAQQVTVFGLQNAKNYHVMILIVNDADSAYSQATAASYTQQVPLPQPVLQLSSTPITTTSAQITWQKPAGYNNTKYTTILFLKADTVINNGLQNAGIASVIASPIFKNGSRYRFDSLAYCIYKADSNIVTVTGLSNTKKYYVSAWVVEDFDSVYSPFASLQVVSKPPPPVFSIGSINKANVITGVVDSLNKEVTLRGIVYGFNQTFNGLSFMLADGSGGIQIISPTKKFGYTPIEGDSLQISGIVGTQRGLAILQNIDTIFKLATTRPLQKAEVVNTLNESTENKLVQLNWLRFATAPAGSNWPTTNSSIKVVKVGTTDTLTVRLLSTSALAGQPLPKGTIFSVTGMCNQVSSSTVAPFQFDGYQIIPRYAADIKLNDSLESFALQLPANSNAINIDTLPATQLTFSWQRSLNLPIVSLPTYSVELDNIDSINLFATPDYSSASDNGGNDTTLVLNNQQLRTMAQTLGIKQGKSYNGRWRVVAATGNYQRTSTDTFTILLKNNFSTGVAEREHFLNLVLLYPNPASDIVIVQSEKPIDSWFITDVSGRMVASGKTDSGTLQELIVEELKSGLYFVTIYSGQSSAQLKLIKK